MQKILLFPLFFLLFSSCYALTAPQELYFYDVLAGGFSEQTLEISSAEATSVTITIAGPEASWLSISPTQGIASPGFPLKLKITAQPPADALPGIYVAYAIVDVPSKDGITTYTGPAHTTKIFVEVTQKEIIQAQVKNIEVFTQGSKIVGLAGIENTGNVNINPSLVLEIQDEKLNSSKDSEEILPSRAAGIKTELDASQLAKNVYYVKSSVYLQNMLLRQDTIPVSLGKPSEVQLQSLQVSKLEAGKPAQVTALFENTGADAVLAKFQASIRHNNEVEQIESEKIVVQGNQIANLTAYFTPRDSGAYTISGYVVFGDSATREQQLNVEVQAAVPLSLSFVALLIFGVIGVLILFFAKRQKNKKVFSTNRRKWYSLRK